MRYNEPGGSLVLGGVLKRRHKEMGRQAEAGAMQPQVKGHLEPPKLGEAGRSFLEPTVGAGP
jgi:hypothetical protein